MATKVSIITIDLGVSIDDIITEDVNELTGQARVELDGAIEMSKAIQKVKTDKDKAAQTANDKLNEAMEKAYLQILETGEIGVPVSSVMATVGEVVPNTSAFTTRMKHILSAKGNPYVLDRKKIHGTPHYIFVAYNQPVQP